MHRHQQTTSSTICSQQQRTRCASCSRRTQQQQQQQQQQPQHHHHYHREQQQQQQRQQVLLKSGAATGAALLFQLLLIYCCCHLNNDILVVQAKPLNQNQVRFRRIPPATFPAHLRSEVVIECEAGGAPPPTIHWLKNGKRIYQGDNLLEENLLQESAAVAAAASSPPDNINRISLSATRSRLVIDCVDYSDVATYTCVAENAYSRIATNTKLNLDQSIGVAQQVAGSGLASENELDGGAKSLSAMSQCGIRPYEQARIHMWTHNMLEVMNNNVLLYCRSNLILQQQQRNINAANTQSVVGTDNNNNNKEIAVVEESEAQQQQQQQQRKPQVSWTLPSEKLVSAENKDRYEILDTGDLLIKDLRWEDMGQYVCTVGDEHSSDTITTFVYPAAVKPIKSKRATMSSTSALSADADFRWMNQ